MASAFAIQYAIEPPPIIRFIDETSNFETDSVSKCEHGVRRPLGEVERRPAQGLPSAAKHCVVCRYCQNQVIGRELRYLGLEPEPDGPGTGAIATGLAVHALLAGQSIDSPEAQKLAAKFEASEWGQRAVGAQRSEREFDFLFELDDVILRGQVDLWFEEAGELVLVDYKTDRDEASAENYALQLRLYALGLEKYAGRVPDRAVLYYVRTDRAVEIGLSARDLAEARGRVRGFREAQERMEFPLRPGGQCKKCSFYGGLCPEGREEEISSGLIFGPPSSFLAPASSDS